MATQRGIVIGGQIATAGCAFSMTGSVKIRDILQWLLYWDEIAYAGVGRGGASISGNQPKDVSFLENEGVFRTEIVDLDELLRPDDLPDPEPGIQIFGLSGNQFAVAAAAARVELARRFSRDTENIWTIGQAGGERLLLPGTSTGAELIDVQLVNCLPVPVEGTAFDDILKFKDTYRDELVQLRFALDDLREKILSSSDERRTIDAAAHGIGVAVTDIRSALQGVGIGSVNESIALYTENPSISFWTVLGGLVAAAKGLPIEVGGAAGLAVPTLCRFLKRSIAGGRRLPAGKAEFAYVYEAVRELGAR